jgi:DNA-binding beta-propeller fold protein YncE
VAVQPNLLLLVDGAAARVIATAQVGWNPTALAVDAARGRVAVLSHDESTITWVGADGAVLSQAFIGITARQLVDVEVRPQPDGQPEVRRRYETIHLQTEPSAVAIDSATGMAWVTNELNGELVAADAEGNIPARYRVGAHPRALAILNGVAYVANWGENTIFAVALADGATRSVLVGYAPSALAVDHARNTLFVAESGRNTLGVIDTATLAYRYLAVGRAPGALLVDPAAGRVYVANHGADTLSIVTESDTQG